jgi:hypothetical protein
MGFDGFIDNDGRHDREDLLHSVIGGFMDSI